MPENENPKPDANGQCPEGFTAVVTVNEHGQQEIICVPNEEL